MGLFFKYEYAAVYAGRSEAGNAWNEARPATDVVAAIRSSEGEMKRIQRVTQLPKVGDLLSPDGY